MTHTSTAPTSLALSDGHLDDVSGGISLFGLLDAVLNVAPGGALNSTIGNLLKGDGLLGHGHDRASA
ncbi:hypothetical protein [Sabulicella rubraurantiaca]|uniref:hypothetical protein n=1 Tax=Sabulicella rubraurantiaca TaxID=2811429 RepID=UPI001A96AE4C|nr:hypothetical protein [Sabulicella rubraurantiaca]